MADRGVHVWHTVSRHPTSDGVVAYQRCHCGLWRVVVGIESVVAGFAINGGMTADVSK